MPLLADSDLYGIDLYEKPLEYVYRNGETVTVFNIIHDTCMSILMFACLYTYVYFQYSVTCTNPWWGIGESTNIKVEQPRKQYLVVDCWVWVVKARQAGTPRTAP